MNPLFIPFILSFAHKSQTIVSHRSPYPSFLPPFPSPSISLVLAIALSSWHSQAARSCFVPSGTSVDVVSLAASTYSLWGKQWRVPSPHKGVLLPTCSVPGGTSLFSDFCSFCFICFLIFTVIFCFKILSWRLCSFSIYAFFHWIYAAFFFAGLVLLSWYKFFLWLMTIVI